jgi:hypothetical protein
MDGKSYPRSISKAYPASLGIQVLEFILLAGIGALGVLIHVYLRVPLKLPGHQGIIYMAILISGKLISKRGYASSLSSIGAAAMLLFPLGFSDPFIPVIYLFPGFIVDLLFSISKKQLTNAFVIALICGLAYATIPFTRVIITEVTGFPYGVFVKGYFFPLFSHFIFGAMGGFLASGTISIFRKKKD